MKILTKWLRSYLPGLAVDDAQLAEDLTLRGIAVEGIYDLGPATARSTRWTSPPTASTR
jgi:phenylalanyl-tRNA synthetase beta chain